MNDLMTRSEAAKVFDVHPQTIANWLGKGLLSTVKMGDKAMISKKSVKTLKKMFRNIVDTEEKIQTYRAESQELLKRLGHEKKCLTDQLEVYSHAAFFAQLVAELYDILNDECTDNRSVQICSMVLNGKSFQRISREYGISSERIRQIISKTAYKLKEKERYMDLLKAYKELKENADLYKKENERLRKHLDTLNMEKITYHAQYKDIVFSDTYRQMLKVKVADLPLSVRSINCMRQNEVETLADLVSCSESELAGFRNLGQKSLYEIKAMLEDKGLGLGMKLENQNDKPLAP